MLRLLTVGFCCMVCLSCNNAANEKKVVNPVDTISHTTDSVPPPQPGSDRDEHGCIPSAGYTWSVLRNKCIRIFEEATIQLKSFSGEERSAFLLFNADHSAVELFAPSESTSVVLQQVKDNPTEWEKGNWRLRKKDRYVLKKNGTTAFLE